MRFRYRNEPYWSDVWVEGSLVECNAKHDRWIVQQKAHWWNRWEYVTSVTTQDAAEDVIWALGETTEWRYW